MLDSYITWEMGTLAKAARFWVMDDCWARNSLAVMRKVTLILIFLV